MLKILKYHIVGIAEQKWMDKLEEYFEQDCGVMDRNRSPFDFYMQGYNRAKLEELERQLAEVKARAKQESMRNWLNIRIGV